jgi:hypothetical protein
MRCAEAVRDGDGLADGDGDDVPPTFSVMPTNGVDDDGAGAAAGWCGAVDPHAAKSATHETPIATLHSI